MSRKINLSSPKLALLSAAAFVGSITFAPAACADNLSVLKGDEQLATLKYELDGLPQLDFSTYTPQLFWMVVIFVLLYVFFARKTLPDLSGTIENRKNHIDSDLKEAEKLTAEADLVQQNYHASIESSQDKAAKSIHDVEAKMKKKAEDAAEDFRARSEAEMSKAEANILKAQEKALGDMTSIAATAAQAAVAKIIGTSIDEKTAKSAVEKVTKQPNNAKKKAA